MENIKKIVNVHEIIGNGKLRGVLLKVFLICFLIGICDGYCMYIFGVTGVTVRDSLGFTPIQQGVINSWATWGMTAATAVVGIIADKIGRKKVLVFSLICYSVFTGLTGFATKMWHFAIVRFLSGVGMAGIVPVSVATTSEYSPNKNRPIHIFVRKVENEDGITLPFTYIGMGHMQYIEGSKKSNGAHLFRIPMANTAPEDIYFDFKLPEIDEGILCRMA